jgi:hypothetical protein
MTNVGNTLMRVVAELFIGCGLLGYVLRDAWRGFAWR